MKRFFSFFLLMASASFIFNGCSPEVDDSTSPTIVFGGGNPMYVKLHTPYKDSLVYFNDASGVALVWNDTSDYNPAHIGSYSVLYYAQDAVGNVATATRFFVVRIEGTTLQGKWSGIKTESAQGGGPVAYTDSLINPTATALYLTQLIPGTLVKMELKGSMGDTLYIPSQIVAFNDTSQTSIKGSGKVAGDGTNFYVDYLMLTYHNNLNDTVLGRLEFQMPDSLSVRFE